MTTSLTTATHPTTEGCLGSPAPPSFRRDLRHRKSGAAPSYYLGVKLLSAAACRPPTQANLLPASSRARNAAGPDSQVDSLQDGLRRTERVGVDEALSNSVQKLTQQHVVDEYPSIF